MFIYILLLVTFLLLPVTGYELSKYSGRVNNKVLLAIAGFFFLHNICFIWGISFIGDYIDYIIFSLEYFFFFFLIGMLFHHKNKILKILGGLGLGVMIISTIIGFFGFFLFIVIAQDYESDKTYNYESEGKTYQTRRYSFGFATLDSIKYSYDTYRRFAFIPLEYTIDSTSFLDTKTKLNPEDPYFKITVLRDTIIFSNKNGASVSKKLD